MAHTGPSRGPGGARIFQIGFSRCGTTSIALFLNRSGIPCVHHDKGRLARRMRANLAAGRRPLEGYDERYRAFADMQFRAPDNHFDGFLHFEALLDVWLPRAVKRAVPDRVKYPAKRLLRRRDGH